MEILIVVLVNEITWFLDVLSSSFTVVAQCYLYRVLVKIGLISQEITD